MAMKALPDYFEEVDSFTPTEETNSHVFSYDGTRTFYLILPDPAASIEDIDDAPTNGFHLETHFAISGATGSPAVRIASTTTLRKDVANYLDYWTPTITVTETELTVKLVDARVNYVPGYKYTLYKLKI